MTVSKRFGRPAFKQLRPFVEFADSLVSMTLTDGIDNIATLTRKLYSGCEAIYR